MSKGLFGSVETSYHNSGEINREVKSEKSGKYRDFDTYGKHEEKIFRDGKAFVKDSEGVYRDKDGKKLTDWGGINMGDKGLPNQGTIKQVERTSYSDG